MVGANKDVSDINFLRKLRKPLIEKKRRDRMNVSIDNLKALLAKSSKNPALVVKMDKAEILELAVTQLTNLHQRTRTQSAPSLASFRAGFRACNKETVRYLNTSTLMPNPLLQDLDNHLHKVCEITSQQKDLKMSSAALLPERRCTSSPVLDGIPPLPRYSPMCASSMFSPISSADVRGHVMHSPLDTVFFKSANRSGSPCNIISPALSTCSSVRSDCSSSGLSMNNYDSSIEADDNVASRDSKSNIVLGHMIKEERPWRPW